MPLRINYNDINFGDDFQSLLETTREVDYNINAAVAGIIGDVRSEGDKALIDYTYRFDGIDLNTCNLLVSQDEIEAAYSQCDPSFIDALIFAYDRIKSFHEHQVPNDLKYVDSAGVSLGYRWTPIREVGLYVPSGLASYPSSLLMNVIPALVAGAERIVICSPLKDGIRSELVLAAAKICGMSEIYRVGGAQAIAAMAYGTKSIKSVSKIAGPGNKYVAEAKRQVFGQVGIDNIAGPSEILVVADRNNNPTWIAIDLMSQAEHDPSAQAILITDDEMFANEVLSEIDKCLLTLPRKKIASASWNDFGAIIIVPNLGDALPLIDAIAPEHLELAVENPSEFSIRVKNAGAIFLGRHTPEAVGDYVAGPNHVLPTARTARFSSGLGVFDFMKRTSLIECDSNSLDVIGDSIIKLAEAEGLGAHALSVSRRLTR